MQTAEQHNLRVDTQNIFDADNNLIQTSSAVNKVEYETNEILNEDGTGTGNFETQEIITPVHDLVSYLYSYDNSKPESILNQISFSKRNPETDEQVVFASQSIKNDNLDRTHEIALTSGENKTTSLFHYLKNGNHTSNQVSSIWFGDNDKYLDNLKYKYDEKGNITEIYENSMLVAKYKYDSLSRLIREDNKLLNKTVTFEYDAGGNIVNRFEYTFTLSENLSEITPTVIPYSYATSGIRDKLMEYNSEQFEYDGIGNPTIYRNNALTWEKGRRLKSYGSIANYEYNAQGIRTSKTMTIPLKQVEGPAVNSAMTLDYFLDGNKIISQQDVANKMFFIYGVDGIVGFSIQYNNTEEIYYYKKNLQGDIIGLYNSDMILIAKYEYDAWGNHIVKYLDNSGNFVATESDFCYNDISNINRFIANKNPFRYRSYYYDFETDLYYLNSRYYDPEIGRFINIDDIGVINDYKDVFNGLNLFAYCINNPIMHVDESGRGFLDWLLGIISVVVVAAATVLLVAASVATGGLLGVAIGAVATTMAINAAIGGVTALANGTSFAAGVFGGAVSGAAIGFSIGLGIMTGGGAIGFIPAILGVLSSNYLAGNLSYVINKGLNGEQITWKGAMTSGGLHIASGLFAFATGFLMGGVGAYNLPKALTNMLKSNLPIKGKLLSEAARNFYSSIILKSSLFWPINAYLNSIRKQQ